MSIQQAIAADRSGNDIEASQFYDEVIQEPDPPIEAVTNLACLYFRIDDYGYESAKNLDASFVKDQAQECMNY